MIISTFFDNIIAISEQNCLTMAETAARCLASGVTGVDVEDAEVEDPRLCELLDAGMQITSMIVRRDFLHSPTDEMVEEVISLVKQYNAPRILLIPGFFEDGEDRSAVENAIRPFTYLCELAEKENITVGVEDYDHRDAPTSSIAGLSFFLEKVPALSCIFDTGNFLFGGEDALEAYRLMKPRITSQLHCKDRTFDRIAGNDSSRSIAGEEMYPCAVGSGVTPIREIVRDLVKYGFDGVLTAELFGTADTLGDLEKSAEHIRNCITEP